MNEASELSSGRWRAGMGRQFLRFRQGCRVALAYEAAREIHDHLRPRSQVLDVGCGNGYIAYHLGALIGVPVQGVDLMEKVEGPIAYRPFDGQTLPFPDDSFDAVLLRFVLHHAQDQAGLLKEAHRVLADDGRLIVYEDVPERLGDRLLCWLHERVWFDTCGPCTFLKASAWQALFTSLGFRAVHERRLSRLHNLVYPVRRMMFVLERTAAQGARENESRRSSRQALSLAAE
jgi:SAM-dependent methyltransferase